MSSANGSYCRTLRPPPSLEAEVRFDGDQILKPTRDPTDPNLVSTESRTSIQESEMAVALSGAVILDQSGTRLKYKRKCESCGWVDGGSVSTSAPRKGSKVTSGFQCTKCKAKQKIVIQGT